MGFCWIKQKRFYNTNDIQAMLSFLDCHKNDREYKVFMKSIDECLDSEDAYAIRDCIEECWYEEFDRYDSAVREYFVSYFEELFITNKKYNNHKQVNQFVVVCTKDNHYGVVDTEDYVVDYFNKRELVNIVKSGIPIDGVSLNGEIKVV